MFNYNFGICGTDCRAGVLYYYAEGFPEEEQKIGRVDDGHIDGDFDRCFGRVYVHGLVRHAVP